MKNKIIEALQSYEGSDFLVNDELIAFIQKIRTPKNKELIALQKEFAQYKMESIKWSVEDFLQLKGWKMTPEQAQEALEYMIRKHDCTIGITWETLEFFAEECGAVRLPDELPEDYWDVIENFLPNYHSRDEVLHSDIMQKFVDGELTDESDLKWMEQEFNSDEDTVKEAVDKLNKELYMEALEVKNAQK